MEKTSRMMFVPVVLGLLLFGSTPKNLNTSAKNLNTSRAFGQLDPASGQVTRSSRAGSFVRRMGPNEWRVVVSATERWFDTGIEVSNGAVLMMTASGVVTWAPPGGRNMSSTIGPNGISQTRPSDRTGVFQNWGMATEERQGAVSLNPYTGQLSDLLPDQVGKYKKVMSGSGLLGAGFSPSDDVFKKISGGTEGFVWVYALAGDRNPLSVWTINFPSAEKAEEGLERLKQHMLSRESPVVWMIREQGAKMKDERRVGKRFLAETLSDPHEKTPVRVSFVEVVWTDGSVLFLLGGAERDWGLQFEKEFPY